MMDDIMKRLAQAAVDTAIDSAKKAAGKVVDGAIDSALERGRARQHCIRCGHELPPNARFCNDCGADQLTPSTSEARPRSVAAPQVRLDPPPLPPKAIAQPHAPFMMPVQDVFFVQGRGTIVTGRVERGSIHPGERVELIGRGKRRATVVTALESFSKSLQVAEAGTHVGCVLQDVQRAEVEPGMMLVAPGSPTTLPGDGARAKTQEALAQAPLLLPVLSVDEIVGRGTMVSGLIEQGRLATGDAIELVGLRATRPVTVSGFHLPSTTRAEAGSMVGCFLAGIGADDVEPGMVLAAPGTVGAHTEIEAELTVVDPNAPTLTVILDGSRADFHIWERDVPCEVHLPPGMDAMPFDERRVVRMTLFMPLALDAGYEFTLRVGGWTVGKGRVSAVYRQAVAPVSRTPVAQSVGVRILEGHSGMVTSVAFSADGRLAISGGDDGTVRLWDSASGQLRKVMLAAGEYNIGSLWLSAVAFAPNGKDVLGAVYTPPPSLLLWDVASGKESARLAGHSNKVYAAVYTPDGRYVVSCSDDHTVRVWDMALRRQVRSLAHPNEVTGVDVSPDGRRAVSLCGDAVLRVWDLAGGAELARIPAGSDYEYPLGGAVAFAPDGRHAATCALKVDLWDLETRTHVRAYQTGMGNIMGVRFFPDGRRLLACSGSDNAGPDVSDNRIYIWDVASGDLLRTLDGHSRDVNAVAVSPDGRHVISGSSDKTVHLWELT